MNKADLDWKHSVCSLVRAAAERKRKEMEGRAEGERRGDRRERREHPVSGDTVVT